MTMSNTYAPPSETNISLSDITTLNSSTTKHGFMPKLTANANKYFDGNGGITSPLQETKTTISSATSGTVIVDFTNFSSYDIYCTGLSGGGGSAPKLEVSTDGGSTWLTTTYNCKKSVIAVLSAGTADLQAGQGMTNFTEILQITLTQPSTGGTTYGTGTGSQSSTQTTYNIGVSMNSTAAVNRVRLSCLSAFSGELKAIPRALR